MTSILIVANNKYNLLAKLCIESIMKNSTFDGQFIVCTDSSSIYKNLYDKLITKKIIPVIKTKNRICVEKFYNIFKYKDLIDDDLLYLDADSYCIKNFISSLIYMQKNFNIHLPLEQPIKRRKWWIKSSVIYSICKENNITITPYNLNGGLFYIKKEYFAIFQENYYRFEQILDNIGEKLIDENIAMFAFYKTLQTIGYDYDISHHSHHINQDLANFWITQSYKTKIYEREIDFYDTNNLKLRKPSSVILDPSIIHYSGSTEKIINFLSLKNY